MKENALKSYKLVKHSKTINGSCQIRHGLGRKNASALPLRQGLASAIPASCP